jgi:hypothetical protein
MNDPRKFYAFLGCCPRSCARITLIKSCHINVWYLAYPINLTIGRSHFCDNLTYDVWAILLSAENGLSGVNLVHNTWYILFAAVPHRNMWLLVPADPKKPPTHNRQWSQSS